MLARQQGTKSGTILVNSLFRVGQWTRAQNLGLSRTFWDSWHYMPVLCALGGLVHEGNVVTVESGIIHGPKVSALSTQDHYYIAQVH